PRAGVQRDRPRGGGFSVRLRRRARDARRWGARYRVSGGRVDCHRLSGHGRRVARTDPDRGVADLRAWARRMDSPCADDESRDLVSLPARATRRPARVRARRVDRPAGAAIGDDRAPPSPARPDAEDRVIAPLIAPRIAPLLQAVVAPGAPLPWLSYVARLALIAGA